MIHYVPPSRLCAWRGNCASSLAYPLCSRDSWMGSWLPMCHFLPTDPSDIKSLPREFRVAFLGTRSTVDSGRISLIHTTNDHQASREDKHIASLDPFPPSFLLSNFPQAVDTRASTVHEVAPSMASLQKCPASRQKSRQKPSGTR